jgi:uncharacterized membrane protein YhfC
MSEILFQAASTLSRFGLLAVGLHALFLCRQIYRVPLSTYGFGMLAWVVSVAVKFAISIPLNPPFLRYLSIHFPSSIVMIVFSLYVGLLTGIFEIFIPYLAIRFSALRNYSVERAIAFGVAFGAIEAILLGVTAIAKSAAVPSGLLFASTIERIAVIVIHTACCYLLFASVRFSRIRYLLAASLIKTLLDGVAGWYHVFTPQSPDVRIKLIWLLELYTALVAVISTIYSFRIKGGSKSKSGNPDQLVATPTGHQP